MLPFNPFSVPVVLLLLLGFLSLTAHAADPVPLYHICQNTTFSPGRNYLSSLISLFSSLSSYAAYNNQFYSVDSSIHPPFSNTSSKIQISINKTSDPIHTLYNCRGDVSSEKCRACVAAAAQELVSKCSRERAAIIWYDECMIRFSNESIFSYMTVRPRISLLNTQNITEQDRFNRLVNTTLTDLASRASNFPIGVKKFGTNQTKFSEFQNLYNLVQCTPDLSSADCNRCLQTAISRLPICCDGKQGGRVLFPSCNVRYELYPFYEGSSTAPTPTQGPPSPPEAQPQPPPTGSASGSTGKYECLTVKVVAVVAPVAVSVLLFLPV